MKYLLPTAKEMTSIKGSSTHQLRPESHAIVDQLASLSLDDLATGFAISRDAAKKEADRFQALKNGLSLGTPALCLFNGLMYRQIDRQTLESHQDFLQNHLFITSSLYGIIPATEAIAPHRLDFHNRFTISGQSLKTYWRPHYDQWATQTTEPIISLLSSEFEEVFSTPISTSFIRIAFHEEKEGKLKTHSTISKKGRGLFIHHIIQEEIQDLTAIKALTFGGFSYQDSLSTPNKLVFVRQV